MLNRLILAAKSAPLMIGGQAVMEGVMMKSRHHIATSVRTPNGKISTRHRKHISVLEKTGLGKIPFVRGAIVLFETMIIGLQELNWSTNASIGEEEEKLSSLALAATLAFSIVLALLLFKLLPFALASLIANSASQGTWVLNILDGILKLIIFISYIALISNMQDVKRLFMYHGAEHKAVNCYEAKKKLTPKNAKPFTLLQPRCGTTFVIYVFAISILVYVLIPLDFGFWFNYLIRIALLPVIAGVAYEWIRFSGKYYKKSAFIRAISEPGMLFQRLTTREPDLKQLEVGITALEKVLHEEHRGKGNKEMLT